MKSAANEIACGDETNLTLTFLGNLFNIDIIWKWHARLGRTCI